MTEQQVAAMLGVLKAVWPRQDIDANTIKAWAWAFADVDDADGQQAVATYLKHGNSFFPVPSDLITIIAEKQMPFIPDEAWAEVTREVNRVGFRPLPRLTPNGIEPPPKRSFSHPLIAAAVDAVGWETICLEGNNPMVRSQFVKALTALQVKARKGSATGAAAVDGGAHHTDAALPQGGA